MGVQGESGSSKRAAGDTLVGLFEVDARGTIQRYAGHPLGVDASAVGRSVFEIGVLGPDVADGIRNALAGHGGAGRLDSSSGQKALQYHPVRDRRGTVAGAVCIIGEQPPAVASDGVEPFIWPPGALSVEDSFVALASRIPLVLWSADADLRVTSAVGGGLEQLPARPPGLVGRSLDELFPGDREQPPLDEGIRRSLDSDELVALETTWRGRTYQHYVAGRGHARGGEGGAIGVAFDVTERKQLEIQCRKQAERAEALGAFLESASETVEELDQLFHSIAVRAARLVGDACGIFLLSQDGQWLDPVAFECTDPDEHELGRRLLDQHRQHVDEGLGGHVVKTGEPLFVPDADPDGVCAEAKPEWRRFLDEYPVYSIILVPLRARGRTVGTIAVARTRPSQRYTEDDRLFFEELARRAALAIDNARLLERARHEAEERQRADAALEHTEVVLREAQKMEAVGQLAGGIAHDFNNLLQVIHSYCTLLQRESDPAYRTHADLAQVLAAAERGATLVDKLLAFSRRQVLTPEAVDVNEIVRNTANVVQATLPSSIGVECSLREPLTPALVDPAQLEQVIGNLVMNASEAMPDGGRLVLHTTEVEIDAREWCEAHDVQAGHYVCIGVTDTGRGMDAATRDRIFEPFFTTKETGKGPGLGLSTAFGIVKQSGGTITAESASGHGSTLRVYLPQAGGRVTASTHDDGTNVAPGGAETILLVEDEPLVRRVVQRVLEDAGYEVVSSGDPVDALALFEQQGARIDLLLSDIVMPNMPGSELARRLREMRGSLRVLYMSGYTRDQVDPQKTGGPEAPILQKPYTPDRLLERVREVLEAPPPGRT